MDTVYKGLIISLLNDKEVIKIEGTVYEINLFLQLKIIVANFTTSSDI